MVKRHLIAALLLLTLVQPLSATYLDLTDTDVVKVEDVEQASLHLSTAVGYHIFLIYRGGQTARIDFATAEAARAAYESLKSALNALPTPKAN
jgi:hypothetical protein